MRQKVLLGTAVIALVVAGVCSADDCATALLAGAFSAGHDDQGYFVRTRAAAGQEKVQRDAPIRSVVEYLASQAGAIVVYVDAGTGRDLAPGEWRADDPLAALDAFARAAAFAVVTPAPRFWIVGIPSMLDGSAVTLFCQPSDGYTPPAWPAEDLDELEFALFQQLPVRGGGAARGMRYLGLAYHWVRGSEPDTLLVVSSEYMGGGPPKYTSFRAFKVNVSRLGGHLQVSCLWSSEEIAGPLVADIQQDFDGDGLQDFVFQRYEDVEGSPVILSGTDGHVLLRFEGAEIATERSGSGAVQVAVWEPGERDATTWEPQVLRFDAGAGHFVPAARQEAALSPHEATRQPKRGLVDLLAAEVGGKDKVSVAKVLREHPTQVVQVTPREMQGGFVGRVLFQYKSPAYASEEKERKR